MGSAGQNGFHDTALVKGPGVVLGRSGASFGQAHFCEADFWPHNTALYVTDFHGNNPHFVFYFLCSLNFSRYNSGGAQQSLNRNFIAPIPVAVPPLPEQEVIAEALSDADAILESLEQLVAKKRQIKQGAMQELLTGKKRLPGFDGAWEVKRLEELAEIRSRGTPSTSQAQYWDGDILWCTPTDITALKGYKYLARTSRTISALGLKYSSAEMIPAHSIVMTSRATIGECAINQVPVTTNQGFKNFAPFENVAVEFLYYLLVTKKQDFISLCGGSTFLEIGKTQLTNFEVQLPATKDEQEAIAAILTDMDAETTALEEKLAKARQLKQGMMHELLTGKTRLMGNGKWRMENGE
jgi:type I restriction enzyme S subunit